MTKTSLVEIVANNANLSKKDADAAVKAVFAAIENELATGGEVSIAGFGSFKVKARPERTGRNPQTKETITIKACKVPSFSAGKALKDAVNK